MSLTKVTNRVLADNSVSTAQLSGACVGTAQLSAGSVTTKLGNEIDSINFRNKIINGDFWIWQRGITFNAIANNSIAADRWVVVHNNGGTRNITRQSFALGQTDVPNNPFYFLRFQQTVAGTSTEAVFNTLCQRIEDVKTLANTNAVLTFWAKAASSMVVRPSINQFFGSGGTPSTTVVTNGPNLTIGTTWQKYTVNFTIPSVAGKQLGDAKTDFNQLTFNLPLNTTFTFDIAQVQLEQGDYPTPFEQRPEQVEVALCQRYYQRIPTFIIGGYGPALNLMWESGLWPVKMRINPADGRGVTVAGTTSSNAQSAAYNDSSDAHFTVRAQIIATGAAWHYVDIIGNADY